MLEFELMPKNPISYYWGQRFRTSSYLSVQQLCNNFIFKFGFVTVSILVFLPTYTELLIHLLLMRFWIHTYYLKKQKRIYCRISCNQSCFKTHRLKKDWFVLYLYVLHVVLFCLDQQSELMSLFLPFLLYSLFGPSLNNFAATGCWHHSRRNTLLRLVWPNTDSRTEVHSPISLIDSLIIRNDFRCIWARDQTKLKSFSRLRKKIDLFWVQTYLFYFF